MVGLQTAKATLQGKRQTLTRSLPVFHFSNSNIIIIINLARLPLLEQQGEVQAGVEGGLPSVQPPPQAQTGSMLKRFATSFIFKSVASQLLINPLSVSGLRQELFPDAITAKRPLSDSDHSLPGLLSIHCIVVLWIWRNESCIFGLWMKMRNDCSFGRSLIIALWQSCRKLRIFFVHLEHCPIYTNIMCLCLIVLWCPRAMS